MSNKKVNLFSILLFSFIVNLHGQAQIIRGSGILTLAGPVTKETSSTVKAEAIKKLKLELIQWLKEEIDLTFDTANSFQNLKINMFLDSCLTLAKTESSYKGKSLNLTLLLTAENAKKKLEDFNRIADERAIQNWKLLQAALQSRNISTIYKGAVSALLYSLLRLGPPIANPEDSSRVIYEDSRRIVQEIFDKMRVNSSGLILVGKTGLPIQNPPVVRVLIDSMPVAGITLTARLQNGNILFSSKTDANGQISFENTRIPFVPNGTLLEMIPNLGAVVGITDFIVKAEDVGISLNNKQVQSYIFKIIKPVYTLDYQATTVSDITLPEDFVKSSHVKKFLNDSCFLVEKRGSEPVDLDIKIKVQVSSYAYDETEEVSIKTAAQIIVNGLLLQPQRTNTNEIIFEKKYNRYVTPPYGLYFWEANGKIREAIKATIAGL
ncbi:MAG: hypothetical protein N2053_04145 [Chitinispirillaceae bacterium]|nr:hypothetical protein [Chitinispirillaceae bacterium]